MWSVILTHKLFSLIPVACCHRDWLFSCLACYLLYYIAFVELWLVLPFPYLNLVSSVNDGEIVGHCFWIYILQSH